MKNLIPFLLYFILISLSSCQYDNLLPGEPNTQGNGTVVLINTAIKMAIGGIVYENLDGHLRITGYDKNNTAQWTKDFDVIGPLDTLEAQGGFHHYSIELVDKWGINDIQNNIPGKDIWDGRADGPLPVTYVLGGAIKARKLSSYVTSREVNRQGDSIVYEPETKTSYSYDGDHIASIQYETYNPQSLQFEPTSKDDFTYEGSLVSKIKTTLNGQPYADYQYEYGIENKIMETLHFDNDLVWTVTFTKNYDSSRVSVNYSLSNGNSFSYAFDVRYKNIVTDKTVQAGQTCNQGNYTYDKNINPFRHLGYIDFNLQNWSAGNRLTEQVDYLACGFPALIPLFYYYTYDQRGYPVRKITKYKSDASQNSRYHTAVDFYYE